jgi:hypothetical protein
MQPVDQWAEAAMVGCKKSVLQSLTCEPILPSRTSNQYLARYWFAVRDGKIGSPVRNLSDATTLSSPPLLLVFICILFMAPRPPLSFLRISIYLLTRTPMCCLFTRAIYLVDYLFGGLSLFGGILVPFFLPPSSFLPPFLSFF